MVLVALGIEVAGEVDVAGGAVTVKVPSLRVRGIELADGSEATALGCKSRGLAPGAAPTLTLKEIVAIVPSGMTDVPP